MPLSTAQSLGWSLARTMMTVIILIETSAGYSVMPLMSSTATPKRSSVNMTRSIAKLLELVPDWSRFGFFPEPAFAMICLPVALWWWRARPMEGRS